MDPNNPASNGGGSPADPANGNLNPDPNAAPANGGVTPPANDPNAPPPDGGKKEPDPVPYGRFKEKVDEAAGLREQVGTLTQQVTYLTEVVAKHQSGAGTSPKEKIQAQNALDDLITSGEVTKADAQKLQRLIDAMGYRRGDAVDPNASKVTDIEKRLDTLTNQLNSEADAKAKTKALKEFEGVVTEEELDTEMKKMANSRDPELKHMATTASYKVIIQSRFHDKIVQAEVDKAIKAKAPPAPKIDPGKTPPTRTPAKGELKYDPSNPKAFEKALKAEIRAKVREKAE